MFKAFLQSEVGSNLYRPSREGFKRLAQEFSMVSVLREAPADLETPVSAYLKLAGGEYSFLLESAEGGSSWGRYSIVGCEPSRVLSWDGRSFHPLMGPALTDPSQPPLKALFQEISAVRPSPLPFSFPFDGGAVGYIGYDMLPHLEKVTLRAERALDLTESAFMFTRRLAIFDHLLSRLFLVVNVPIPPRLTEREADRLYGGSLDELEEMSAALRRRIDQPREPLYVNPRPDLSGVEANMSPQAFMDMVERALDYIHAGEAFQVVLSQRFRLGISCEPFEIYRALRMENPSPYMFFLRFGDLRLVGSSPEPMVRRRGDEVIIRPIAGTRPRGRDASEDEELERELQEDEKERAEHVMLVDLARNDLGRVCKPGSVEVREMMRVERYSQVMHLVSEVRGTVAPGTENLKILRASFPAGTVSGAPKVRACQIIDELEKERRGIYAGAVGYLDYHGDLDCCIAIRTLVCKGREAWVQAGAGVVADSQPEREYRESVNKALALLRAVKRAEAAGGWGAYEKRF